MDRIDIFIETPQIKFEKLNAPEAKDYTLKIKQEIEKAREIQKERFLKDGSIAVLTNSEIRINQIKKYCQIDYKSQNILRQFVDSGKLSGRGYHRVLKTARTIADLDGSDNIKYEHVAEALMYRIRED